MSAVVFAYANLHALGMFAGIVAAVLLCLAVGCLVTAVGMRKR